MKKEQIYIDLSKCSEEELKQIKSLTKISAHYINYAPYLFFFNNWKTSNGGYVKRANLTELTYPEFIKLFEGGESKEVLQLENNEWIKSIAISHQKQMSSTHPHAIIGTIEDAIIEALEKLNSNQ